MAKIKDISGLKFGRLTVIQQVSKPNKNKDKHTYWLCKCDCRK